ncbi:MAG: ribonuclease Z [Ferruginibacter sp.]
MLGLTILGNNSALPAFGRNPTAQILQTDHDMMLIDCGEGTQLQMSKFKIKRNRLKYIFISHLHGDHYFGLVGLLTSMGLANRTDDIHIYAPPMLKEIIELQLTVADTRLPYTIYYHSLEKESVITETQTLTVSCFKVHHRIECFGFLFKEKKMKRSIDPTRAQSYEVPPDFYEQLQNGMDYITKKGTIIPNDQVTIDAPRAASYAYCADTLYHDELVAKVKDVDVLYYETTYLNDMSVKAVARFHSTTVQAGEMAKKAGVKKLLIGHFSSKYETLDQFLSETSEVFQNTELALEGTCYRI